MRLDLDAQLVAATAERAFAESESAGAALDALGGIAPISKDAPLSVAAALVAEAAGARHDFPVASAILAATLLGQSGASRDMAGAVGTNPSAVPGHREARFVVLLRAGKSTLHRCEQVKEAGSDPLLWSVFRATGTAVAEGGDLWAEALTLLSAELYGAARAAFRSACDHLSTRQQFDRPLSSFQTLRHRAAQDWARLRDIEATLAGACATDGSAALHQARIAKAVASDAAPRIVENAIHAHGAMGFTEDAGLGRHLVTVRRAAVCLGGPSEHYKTIGETFLADLH